jgi:hypothetical protein
MTLQLVVESAPMRSRAVVESATIRRRAVFGSASGEASVSGSLFMAAFYHAQAKRVNV